jgi:hypothetical protein
VRAMRRLGPLLCVGRPFVAGLGSNPLRGQYWQGKTASMGIAFWVRAGEGGSMHANPRSAIRAARTRSWAGVSARSCRSVMAATEPP